MNPTLQNGTALLARILLAFIFIMSGFGKIGGFSGTAAAVASKGIPLPEVATVATIAIEFLGGLLLVAGWKARWAALAIFLFVIPTTFLFHNPSGLPADQAQAQMIHLMKNVSIMGGMLMLVAFGPGAWSLDGRGGKDRS